MNFGSNHRAFFDLNGQSEENTVVPGGLKRSYDFFLDVRRMQPDEGFILRLNTLEWEALHSGTADTARPNLAGYPQYAPTPTTPAALINVRKNPVPQDEELNGLPEEAMLAFDITNESQGDLWLDDDAQVAERVVITLGVTSTHQFVSDVTISEKVGNGRGLILAHIDAATLGRGLTIVQVPVVQSWGFGPQGIMSLVVTMGTSPATTVGDFVTTEVGSVTMRTTAGQWFIHQVNPLLGVAHTLRSYNTQGLIDLESNNTLPTPHVIIRSNGQPLLRFDFNTVGSGTTITTGSESIVELEFETNMEFTTQEITVRQVRAGSAQVVGGPLGAATVIRDGTRLLMEFTPDPMVSGQRETFEVDVDTTGITTAGHTLKVNVIGVYVRVNGLAVFHREGIGGPTFVKS